MWKVLVLNDVVDSEIRALPEPMRARLAKIIDLIETSGLERLPRDLSRHLEDKLWELRVRDRDGISRAIYITATGQRVVILRVFVKKTQKTPPQELRLAKQRARDIDETF